MAPRKIIDTDLVEIVECPTASSSSKKFKQILLEIEHVCIIFGFSTYCKHLHFIV